MVRLLFKPERRAIDADGLNMTERVIDENY
jgi:hypothetical protein